jgi:hypothetical protein
MTMRARSDELLVDALGDELVVYDTRNHTMHRLNASAAAVWRLCDGVRTPAEIAADLGASDLDEAAVRGTIEDLESVSLLEPNDDAVEQPLISRRSALRKIGVGGGIVLGLPLVESLVAPTPALAWGRGTTGGNQQWSPDYEHTDFKPTKPKKNDNNNENNNNNNENNDNNKGKDH